MIYINGEPAEIRAGASVIELLRSLDLNGDGRGIAVAIDAEVVPRADWPDRLLRPGERVEIVRAVQGG